MELKQLRFFAKVAELSSMRAASEALNITQPALGTQIRNLEANLGASLFARHSRGVTLTVAGEKLLKHADVILQNVRIAEEDLTGFGREPSGVVKIGVTPSMGRVLIPELFEICSDRFPGVELTLKQAFAGELDVVLDSGGLDMAFSTRQLDTISHESLPLITQAMFLVGSPKLLAGLRSPVSIEQVVCLPLVMDGRTGSQSLAFKRLTDERGLAIKDVLGVDATSIRRELVLTGGRSAISPYGLFAHEIASGQLVALEIDAPNMIGTLNLNTRRIEAMSETEKAIRQLIIEIVDRNIAEGKYLWEIPVAINSSVSTG